MAVNEEAWLADSGSEGPGLHVYPWRADLQGVYVRKRGGREGQVYCPPVIHN